MTLRDMIEALPKHEFIDSYEQGTLWTAVDYAAIINIINQYEARFEQIRIAAIQRDDGQSYWLGYANGVEAALIEVSGDE